MSEPGRDRSDQTIPNVPESDPLTIAVLCVLLGTLTWIVFGQTLHHGFVNYDDDVYVYQNPQIVSGLTLHRIPEAFTYVHSGNWHPLTWLSHMLDCRLYGLHAGGHHLTNVLLHFFAVVLLFLVLHKMTRALWRSVFVAGIFAIHPLRVESVAWISERKDVFSGVFFMLTLFAYLRYVSGTRSLFRYLLVLLFFTLGLMAKPMLVTLPCVLLLLDYWPLRRFRHDSLGDNVQFARRSSFMSLLVEKIPLFNLSAAVSLVTWWAQQSARQAMAQPSFVIRLENAVVSYIVYLRRLFWPVDLAPFYPYPSTALPLTVVLTAVFLFATISIVVLLLRRKFPYLVTGWGWYVIMLLPVIGLVVQVGAQALADRYTYLPQVGITIALTWTIGEVSTGVRRSHGLLAAASVVIIVVFSWAAYGQTRYWKNSEILWRHALSVTQNNQIAHNGLGEVLLEKGQTDDALSQFRAALKITPGYYIARNNLGMAYLQKDEMAAAIAEFRHVLSHEPRNEKTRFNLAAAFLRSGRTIEAISEYENALTTKPDVAQGHFDLGNAFMRIQRRPEAIAHFETALRLQPNYVDAECSLAIAQIQIGNRSEAIRHLQHAFAAAPDNSAVQDNLAAALLVDGRLDKAIPYLERSLALRPANVEMRNNLAFALTRKEQWPPAIVQWQKSLAIDPSNLDAQIALAWIFATAPDAAVRNGAEALAIAKRLCGTAPAPDPIRLRVLAAADAEVGCFDDAIEAARRALDLATARGDTEQRAILQKDMALLQSGQPLRDAVHLPITR